MSFCVYYKLSMNGQGLPTVADFLKKNIWELLFLGHSGLNPTTINSAV